MSYRSRSRKRYSSRTMSRRPVSRRRRAPRRIPRAIRGYVRTGGNYGRYQGAGGTELKTFDNAAMADDTTADGLFKTVPPSLGVVVSLLDDGSFGIGQGTGVTQRLGNKIVLKSIFLTGMAGMTNAHAKDGGDLFRWWIILDSQCNGVIPFFTDVFGYTKNGLSGTGSRGDIIQTGAGNPIRNLSNSKRFRILKEGVMSFCATAVDTVSTEVNYVPRRPFKCYMKCNIPIEYGASGASFDVAPILGRTASIKSNAVYLFTQGVQAFIGISYVTRVRFADA